MRVSFTAYYYRTLQATASYSGARINFFFFLYPNKILGVEKKSGGGRQFQYHSWEKKTHDLFLDGLQTRLVMLEQCRITRISWRCPNAHLGAHKSVHSFSCSGTSNTLEIQNLLHLQAMFFLKQSPASGLALFFSTSNLAVRWVHEQIQRCVRTQLCVFGCRYWRM